MSKTYLISGGNRGIGKGLVCKLLNRPNTTVVTLVRDPSHETSQSLWSLPKAEGSKLIVEKYDAMLPDSALRAIEAIQSKNDIHVLDVVIANSGNFSHWGHLADVQVSDLESHFRINAVGPILLFQATLGLLRRSAKPKFFTISSTGGSIGLIGMTPVEFDGGAYGMSKAAVNYAMRKLHFENPGIVIQPCCPGWAKTEMGQYVADNLGVVEQPPVEVGDSVDGVLRQIDSATKEETSGRFLAWDGEELPW